MTAEFVIGAYRRLFPIEKSFRMSERDLQARPVYRHGRDPIEALLIVFAAQAVSRWIEEATAADLLPDDVNDPLDRAYQQSSAR